MTGILHIIALGSGCKDVLIRRHRCDRQILQGSTDQQSSAAFVVAGMLSFLTINDLADQHGVNDLVQLAMASEHRMGVQTGGMDVSDSCRTPARIITLRTFST